MREIIEGKQKNTTCWHVERGERKRYQGDSKILILGKGRKASLVEIRTRVITTP